MPNNLIQYIDTDTRLPISPEATLSAGRSYEVTLPDGADQARDLQYVLQDWNYTAVNASGTTTIRNVSTQGPVTYGGVIVLAAAGAHTITLYDATAASGQILPGGNALSVNAASEKIYNPGIRCANGITASLSGDPTDNYVLVLWK